MFDEQAHGRRRWRDVEINAMTPVRKPLSRWPPVYIDSCLKLLGTLLTPQSHPLHPVLLTRWTMYSWNTTIDDTSSIIIFSPYCEFVDLDM